MALHGLHRPLLGAVHVRSLRVATCTHCKDVDEEEAAGGVAGGQVAADGVDQEAKAGCRCSRWGGQDVRFVARDGCRAQTQIARHT